MQFIQGKLTLVKRWIKILSRRNCVAVQQGEGKIYSRDKILGYYNDLTGKVNKNTILDSNGIPINIIANGKKVYFPISIFQYALGLWDLYLLTNEEKRKLEFFKQCEWIIANQKENGSWDCFGPIGYSNYSVSSMGQGEAISVLLRAYEITGEQRWLESAKQAINFMCISVDEGGTLFVKDNNYYFEEYPDKNCEKHAVLNGWIFSLFGIYDFLKINKDVRIENIYEKSLETLKRNLISYDMGYWTYYDKSGRIASPAYHNLHVALLNTLSEITNETYFKKISNKWKGYAKNNFYCFKAITRKLIQKIHESPEGIIVQ